MSTDVKHEVDARRSNVLGDLLANWRQYVVYIGFVLIFLFFALTLQDRGFLSRTIS